MTTLTTKSFFGVVEERMDSGHVRVRAFETHPFIRKDDVPTKFLPPALVLLPTTSGYVDSGSPGHNLQIDSWVRGEFLDYPVCMQPIITHVIKGGMFSMSNAENGRMEFIDNKELSNLPENPYHENKENSENNKPIKDTGSNLKKTYDFSYDLASRYKSSDPHMHSSAICGVLLLETSNINPSVVNSIGAWGICQWLGERKRQLFAKYGKTKDLREQLAFMEWELNNTETKARSNWLAGKDLKSAVEGFCTFERAEEMIGKTGRVNLNHPNFKKRFAFANQVYKNMRS